MGMQKVDSAWALIGRGWEVNFVNRCLRVSRAQSHVIPRRVDARKDSRSRSRRRRRSDDMDMTLRILPCYRNAAHVWLSSRIGAASQTGRTWWHVCDQRQTSLPVHALEFVVALFNYAEYQRKELPVKGEMQSCSADLKHSGNQWWWNSGKRTASVTKGS